MNETINKNKFDALRWRLRFAHRHAESRLLLWLAPRLPHALVVRVLAHVAVATLRPDEVVSVPSFMELFGRWERRELQGNAADRHGAS